MDSLTISLIIALLIALNGIYVAAEFALVGVPRSMVDQLAAEGHKAALRLQRILTHPRLQDRYIAGTQLGVTFASLGLGMYGEHALAKGLIHWFEALDMPTSLLAHAIASVVAVVFLTYLHVVLGEMVPKSLALAGPRRAVFFTMPFALFTSLLFYPLVVGLEWISNRILQRLGVDRSVKSLSHYHTEEDLAHIVRASRASGATGTLRPESADVIADLLEFRARLAGEVMVPRVAFRGIPLGSTPEQITDLLKEVQHTRYPVYEDNVDNILGMVHIKDLLLLLRQGQPLERDRVRPINFVPETVDMDQVLAVMREARTHMVVVMDEQGGTAGLLTVKDMFEEVVGTISEGAMEAKERQGAYRDAHGRLRVAGTLRLDELEEVLEAKLPETGAETVSGLVLLQKSRPAQLGDVASIGAFQLVVVEIEGRGVKECLVRPKPAGQ